MNIKDLEKQNCPVCHSRFFEDDDIVFCPVCGCPHHRDCYNAFGHCKYEEFHNTEKQWQFNPEPSDDKNENGKKDFENENSDVIICPNCKNEVDKTTLFCPGCGYPIMSSGQQNPNANHYAGQGPYRPHAYPYPGGADMFDPLGGVKSDEDLGGASAIDCTSFIKINTVRFIPKFAKMNRENKKTSWNWCSFLFPEYYFLYRKNYFVSAAAIIAYLIVAILQSPLVYWVNRLPVADGTITYNNLIQNIAENLPTLSTANLILFICGWVFLLVYHIFFGIYGDYFIKKNCISKIKSFKNNDEIEDYHMAIAVKGGVNIFAPLIGYLCIEFFSIILTQIMFGILF